MQFKQLEQLSRRRLMALAAGGLAGGIHPLLALAEDGSTSGSSTIALARTGLVAKVVVVGGGMAGATVAKYLRLWGGAGISVTLVEPDAAYTSNIMSNLVLNGSRTVSSLQYTWSTLASRYGVVRKAASVRAIDAVNQSVTLSDGSVLTYDRLVLAPGVEFDNAYGLTQADYESRTPHAWRAGPQTALLQRQIGAMVDRDVFVMTIPKAPYRCPPGPYERACLVADYLKTRKGPNCKVLVLDENADITAEKENFTKAFTQIHAGVIEYRPGVTQIAIDPVTRAVTYSYRVNPLDAASAVESRSVMATVVNPIPPHRAAGSAPGGWMSAVTGLADGAGGRWAQVDLLSYESTAVRNIHVIGDAAQCGLPNAGHVGNQEAKICADAIVRLMGRQQPDPAPVANSACFSPITASTASWLTAVYQYVPATATSPASMQVAANGGKTAGAKPIEAATINSKNFKQMGTWFKTLMADTFA